MLGHSDPELEFQENVWIYIRKHKRFINLIRKELTAIEAELEAFEIKPAKNPIKHTSVQTTNAMDENNNEDAYFVSEETLLHLLQTHPKLAMKLIEEQFSEKKVSL